MAHGWVRSVNAAGATRIRSRLPLWSLALCTVLAACTGPADHFQPSRHTSAARTADAVAACAHPGATAGTDRPIGVGASNAPTIGPFTFHPYPYQSGYPTKMIIHAVQGQTRTIVLTGQRCSDRRPLRFWYARNQPLPDPPLTVQQLQSLGDSAAALPPIAADTDHTGYALFTGTGRWEITVQQGGRNLGVLLVTVVQP